MSPIIFYHQIKFYLKSTMYIWKKRKLARSYHKWVQKCWPPNWCMFSFKDRPWPAGSSIGCVKNIRCPLPKWGQQLLILQVRYKNVWSRSQTCCPHPVFNEWSHNGKSIIWYAHLCACGVLFYNFQNRIYWFECNYYQLQT